jgi:iron only hydrogenase large subunit-like protein
MLSERATYNHSIYFEPSKCEGEMACLKVCPVEAIRIRNKTAKMLTDKCIDCGECVKICKTGAIVPLTNTFKDFSKFKYTVAIPSLALYSQFDRHIKPKTILSSLKKIGFDEVADITRACISLVKVLLKYIKDYNGKKPVIVSFCPTCIKLIQMRYPELIGNIAPIISPMEITAKEIRKEVSARTGIKSDEIGVIYITPCPPRMIQISENYNSDMDGSIPVSEIYNTLYTAIQQVIKDKSDESEYFDISGFGLNMAISGGLRLMTNNENSISVSGINNVLFILEEIEKGRLHNVDFVEMDSCPEGCIGGPLVVENTYISRTNLVNLINHYGETKIPIGKKNVYDDCEMIYENIFEPLAKEDVNVDIKDALKKISERKRIFSGLPKIDCGACGSPTCETFAEDVVSGEVKINDCVILENEELKNILKKSGIRIQ